MSVLAVGAKTTVMFLTPLLRSFAEGTKNLSNDVEQALDVRYCNQNIFHDNEIGKVCIEITQAC